jgi:hypothetical protein
MNGMLKRCAVTAMAFAVLILAGCTQPATNAPASNETPAAATPAAPPEPVAAKTAFWLMYTPARSWAPDIQTISVVAGEVPGFKNEAGKAAMWQATFGSPTLRQSRVYTYAIATVQPDIRKGVTAGVAGAWSGITRNAMPIDLTMFTVDSDAAYQAAASDAADYLKKNPDKHLSSLELGDSYRFPSPAWYLVWGDAKSGYAAFVDAGTGKVLKKK